MHRISELWLEIKRFVDVALGEWGMLAILCLVGLGAFGLGRLSVLEATRTPVALQGASAAEAFRGMHLGGEFVASRTGGTYYYPWCGGAQNIKAENQIWFTSEAAARKAGYAPAKNCKGLEK